MAASETYQSGIETGAETTDAEQGNTAAGVPPFQRQDT